MKLPKQAKKVFTGEIFDIYQWPQKIYNGKIVNFEMTKRPDTVQIIAVKNKKILLAYEEQPNTKCGFSLFGGRVDKGESPLNAAKRELKEEAGAIAKKWSKLYSYQPVSKIDWEITYFIAHNCELKYPQNLDGGEKIKIMEVSFEEFFRIQTNEFRGFWLSYYLLYLKENKKLNEFKKFLLE